MNTRVLTQTKPGTTSAPPVRSNLLQRKCAYGGTPGPTGECEGCRKKRESKTLQRETRHASSLVHQTSEVPPIVHEVLHSPGQPLDRLTRAFMEPRLGHDFGHVRVHSDGKAAESARAVHARAYTVGHNVVFGANEFAPATHQGRQLLAHELAHTIQQRDTTAWTTERQESADLEKSATAAGRELAEGKSSSQYLPASTLRISRAPDPRFTPGGFTDEEAEKVYREAQSQIAFGLNSLDLADKQARRAFFFDDYGNLSDSRLQLKLADPYFQWEMLVLDIYWDPKGKSFRRQPYVDRLEAPVMADANAKRAYDAELWGRTHNQPETESRFHALMAWVCKHTEPCSSNMEQFHQDLKRMSRWEALNRGMARLFVFVETAALPGGPSGPVAGGPKVRPGELPSGELAPKTGEPAGPEQSAPPPEAAQPANQAAPSAPAKPVTYTGGEAVSPADVRAAYRANPFSVKKSLSDEFHQPAWEREVGTERAKGETAPIAFRMRDGGIRVNEVRWLAVGDLSEINAPHDLGPAGVPAAAPKGKAPAVDPLAKTGGAVDPLAKTGESVDPLGGTGAQANPARQTQYTQPPKPKAAAPPVPGGPRGYTPVPVEVVVEAYRINPHVISASGSTKFHNQVWRFGGGKGKAPDAFRVGDMIRVDIGALPAAQRALLGYEMFIGK